MLYFLDAIYEILTHLMLTDVFTVITVSILLMWVWNVFILRR